MIMADDNLLVVSSASFAPQQGLPDSVVYHSNNVHRIKRKEIGSGSTEPSLTGPSQRTEKGCSEAHMPNDTLTRNLPPAQSRCLSNSPAGRDGAMDLSGSILDESRNRNFTQHHDNSYYARSDAPSKVLLATPRLANERDISNTHSQRQLPTALPTTYRRPLSLWPFHLRRGSHNTTIPHEQCAALNNNPISNAYIGPMRQMHRKREPTGRGNKGSGEIYTGWVVPGTELLYSVTPESLYRVRHYEDLPQSSAAFSEANKVGAWSSTEQSSVRNRKDPDGPRQAFGLHQTSTNSEEELRRHTWETSQSPGIVQRGDDYGPQFSQEDFVVGRAEVDAPVRIHIKAKEEREREAFLREQMTELQTMWKSRAVDLNPREIIRGFGRLLLFMMHHILMTLIPPSRALRTLRSEGVTNLDLRTAVQDVICAIIYVLVLLGLVILGWRLARVVIQSLCYTLLPLRLLWAIWKWVMFY